jgi:hypothetical protein
MYCHRGIETGVTGWLHSDSWAAPCLDGSGNTAWLDVNHANAVDELEHAIREVAPPTPRPAPAPQP